MTTPAAPLNIEGMCPKCGYRDHPVGCAMHPCIRCHHANTMRNDGTVGYTIEAYLECICACHRRWRAAYDAAVERGESIRHEPKSRPMGMHKPQDEDWA